MSAISVSSNMLRRTVLTSRLVSHPTAAEASLRAIRATAFGAHRSIQHSARIPAITASQARRRPEIRSSDQRSPVGLPADTKRTIFIQTETTPNEDALKFIPDHRILPEDFPKSFLEFLSPRDTITPPYPSPLAANLMNIDGVSTVLLGPDFVTVVKSEDASWAHIKPEVFSMITQSITSGENIVNMSARSADGSVDGGEVDSLAPNENDSEVVAMIKELLETRIRPAIQEDGGDIEFRGFENGTAMVKLRGSCRTCSSSTITLKNGIESMLMHYIEEVEAVEQVTDQEEEVAIAEFAKFEEKLAAQKGPDAIASTGGKGTLDAAY